MKLWPNTCLTTRVTFTLEEVLALHELQRTKGLKVFVPTNWVGARGMELLEFGRPPGTDTAHQP